MLSLVFPDFPDSSSDSGTSVITQHQSAWALGSAHLDSDHSPSTYQLGDLKQVLESYHVSVSSSVEL